MYCKYINLETIQKCLLDGLRKGSTILPAIECYNSIDEHLYSIDCIEDASKILIDFLKHPKSIAFCRYPLLLYCLVVEFMAKLKLRFPVYESLFDHIQSGFKTTGELFTNKLKDERVINYHLNKKDIKKRNCLHIMAKNRIYQILHSEYIGNLINKQWSGSIVYYGFEEISSFTLLMKDNIHHVFFKMKQLYDPNRKQKQFWFSYYSYRDIPLIRYYFKESINVFLVICHQILVYFAIRDGTLENSRNNTYFVIRLLILSGSLLLLVDKINSIIFFVFVNRWYEEMDSLVLFFVYFLCTYGHFYDVKRLFINDSDYDTKNVDELINAFLISVQFAYLWYKIIDNLKASKAYGGFIRIIFVVFRKLFLLIIFFFCFIVFETGAFNMLFQQTLQFQSYSDTFFYLTQAAFQEYALGDKWNGFLISALSLFMLAWTLVFINLFIAIATRIYADSDSDILPEQRVNLIKLTEYLRWDEQYGLFKFLYAPFNIIQAPFTFILLFTSDKEYWNDCFSKFLFVFPSMIFFSLFILYQLIRLPLTYLYLVFVYPFYQGFALLRTVKIFFLGLFILFYYFLLDLISFWSVIYTEHKSANINEYSEDIVEFKQAFSSLITVVSKKIESDRKSKRFWIPEFIDTWLETLNLENLSPSQQMILNQNRMHKKSMVSSQFLQSNSNSQSFSFQSKKSFMSGRISQPNNSVSLLTQFKQIFDFLFRFADKEGYIDRDIAKNIFPKKIYYDDDYFEFIYYFHFKYFKNIIVHFTKMSKEIKKDMDKLRGICLDFAKMNDKFKTLKSHMRTLKVPLEEINALVYGINRVNFFFAGLENHLNDAQQKELVEKMAKESTRNGILDNLPKAYNYNKIHPKNTIKQSEFK